MPKAGERSYLSQLGEQGRRHARDKPFSDAGCARYLLDLGAILALLPPPPARLLDLGAGTGWTSVFFALRGYEVVGQDIAEDMIDLARENRDRNGACGLEFVVGDYEDLRFESEFDCAVFYDSLHHAEDEQAALDSSRAPCGREPCASRWSPARATRTSRPLATSSNASA